VTRWVAVSLFSLFFEPAVDAWKDIKQQIPSEPGIGLEAQC
jgi:hypothetical protein